MARLFFLFVSIVVMVLPAQAQPVNSPPVTVFAAASLRDALSEIATKYPAEVTLSFAGSGTLARQIDAGAPADVVILAHRDWSAWLSQRGLILNGTQTEIAGGRLVLVGAADAPDLSVANADTLLAALDGGRLAIGQRDGVPAGAYAREWLTDIDAWDTLLPQLAETDSVRAALALVAVGAAPLGVVYASDAVAEARVRVVYTVPDESHSAIRYPAAAVTEAGRPFLTLLSSPAAAAIFAKYGFTP
ncbi:molybdate ABC transporter substrate-binding protein [Sulfitobacter guttiformis]|uniref:Molybdate transport system substrate-binding protein n=1 Tax=Sulfitobacter guttiformis TaxID=74349 RepID=A0A420DP56_9RHOB|nr:molybdate ABC transporter substrate-binding protein [Sulfitobacter guttiformis]KIN73359.1 Molybdate ABC transporter, periplasmic molybdate-binding protein [Sulfitobacter guttiformis KCTC 32187]RKE96025.1 molybdate transport system substrate-binding protein [Sulfitobacter guttiformis]